MFKAETIGLQALNKYYPLKVPQVLDVDVIADQQYLLQEWLAVTQPNTKAWEEFGIALAQLHRATHTSFGWDSNNYLGAIEMTNTWCVDWAEFYTVQRVMPLVKSLKDDAVFSAKDVQMAEQFCSRLKDLIPAEPPALLHGDLWSGNVSAITENGKLTTAIYDPSAFYGHREIDIALTRLFGGFPTAFYESYQAAYPLTAGWQQRLPVFQISHLLLHAVLFGGSYVGRCKEIMNN